MVSIEANKIDNVVIVIKILTIIKSVIAIIFMKFLVARIAEIVIDN